MELRYDGSKKLETIPSGVFVDGNLGVGTSSPSYVLDVRGTGYVDGVFRTGDKVGILTASAPTYELQVEGDIYASGEITGLSDRRVKADVRPIEGALDKVARLNGCTFVRREPSPDDEKEKTVKEESDEQRPSRRLMGLIAQDVLEVVPEVVKHDPETDLYGLCYGNMVGLLVEAVKDLRTQNL
ncbi:MAG: tail fiber domain-containing protein, partial [Halobacteriaceae archaeon]